MKIDTGAQCNVIPIEKYYRWNIEAPINQSKSVLSNYSGSNIEVHRQCKIGCISNKRLAELLTFQVVKFEKDAPVVLGLEACQSLNLVKRNDAVKRSEFKIINENKDLFEGLGKLKNYKYEIK